jgi:glyoxylase-like metal-dependent hydrolase (beta-lactamase superfamily II)
MKKTGSFLFAALVASLMLLAVSCTTPATSDKPAARGVRLYVLDGGVLGSDPARYQLTKDDVETTDLSVAAFLIVHPQGVLLWDTGSVPDQERVGEAVGGKKHLVLFDGQERNMTLGPPILDQIAAAGYKPSDIKFLALSHYHWDHTANANAFPQATWLARQADRDAMFVPKPVGSVRPETYASLEKISTMMITADEHDVFGDGTVVLKSAPGHTAGHQVLYVKLEKTGGVLLSGDLYHYPAERTLGRLPTFEVDARQTETSRQQVEAFIKKTGAALWIQHELPAHRKLKKSPEYYD